MKKERRGMVELTLEEKLRERQDRLRDALARPRAEVVQRVARWLGDLRFGDSFHALEDIEQRVLPLVDDIRRGIEDVQGIQTGYAAALAERQREVTRVKTELENLDALDPSRRRRFESYHLAQADMSIYEESREAIEASRTELERGFQQRVQNLEPTIERYITAKITAMVKEAEEVLEAARGKMVHAEQLTQTLQLKKHRFVRDPLVSWGLLTNHVHNGGTKRCRHRLPRWMAPKQ
ncbi:MAG: hypothetical protein KGL31_06640, partial [candidate division NC10 bacterium]|nr:hypothetical protein [candidate division NC10 bacterium]